jgi:hypothetical protein
MYGGTGVQTQGLELDRKALYHLSHISSFCFYLLKDIV